MRALPYIFGVLVVVIVVGILPANNSTGEIDRYRCWPIPASSATGNIRCWSGGKLIYHQPIYHNGGVVCSVTGMEIKVSSRNDWCVIESNQNDVWNPPAKGESK